MAGEGVVAAVQAVGALLTQRSVHSAEASVGAAQGEGNVVAAVQAVGALASAAVASPAGQALLQAAALAGAGDGTLGAGSGAFHACIMPQLG